MAKNNSLPDFVKDMANALRAKTGTTAKINPQDFSAVIASIETATDPKLQNKTVTPTTSQQSVKADSGYDGLNSVTVNAVTSSIDANISAGNIKSGVSILGVTGTLEEGITPEGTLEITENDTYDVTTYASVEVNVESGGATPFADATIEEIQQIGNEISAKGMTSAEVKSKYGWKIGDTKDITLTTDEVIQMRIIGFNHDTLSDGSGTAGITLDMATCLNSYYPMDSDRTNAGGWEVTDMRTTTLPTIKATLPQEWQNIIKKVDKKSANGGNTNFSEVVTTSDALFLLSEIEVFGKFIQAQNSTDEGLVYEYYSINNTQDSRKKPIGSYNQWWLRSSNIDNTTSFLKVDYNGNGGSQSATSTDRVSFAFCVGSVKDIPVAGKPIEATTDQEMTNALTQDNLGKVYKFTGTSDTYETDAIYIVSEV